MNKREQLAKQMAENLQELKELDELEELIVDNKIEFEYKNKKYRVRVPTYRETKMIEEAKIKKEMELLNKTDENGNPIYLFEEELIDRYRKAGIDIDAITKEIQLVLSQIEDLMLTLAVMKSPTDREKLREQIIDLREKHAMLSMKKADYLSNSIEAQIAEHGIIYTLFLVLEELSDDKWEKVFETFDNLLDYEDQGLIQRGLYFLMKLMQNA